jgi:hypothetical protein
METPSLAICQALRKAELYGYLIARTDRLYYPGGAHPVCTLYTAQEMVRAGWLTFQGGRYEITPGGRRAAEAGQSALK